MAGMIAKVLALDPETRSGIDMYETEMARDMSDKYWHNTSVKK